MEKTLSQTELVQPHFSKVRVSFGSVAKVTVKAADFVWQGLFSSQLRMKCNPEVSHDVRNESADRVKYQLNRLV